MTKASIARWAFATALVFFAVAAGYRALGRRAERTAPASPAIPPATAPPAGDPRPGFLYGRITTVEGATYEGRLRWGGDEEAFWGDYFNGAKDENPWLAQVSSERLPKPSRPVEIFGLRIARSERGVDFDRPFMSRFGDIARIEAHGREVRVTLKSGTVFDLDRFEAGDFDDGVRVWDARQGVVDLDSWRVRAIEFLATPELGAAPGRLHGTVRTRQGAFTGFVQWNREEGVGTDELDGRADEGELHLRFDTLRSIARGSRDSSRVTLLDGRELVLSGTAEVGRHHRGVYVDDRRYGRVLISRGAFERIDFSPLGQNGSGPAYDDFPPGRPLRGSVTTRDGRRVEGRLVYDLDESETTETLDAPAEGVDYTLPFGLIAAIVLAGGEERGAQRVRVTLHDGEELLLERGGDLGEGTAGVLIFVDGRERPEYLRAEEVQRIDFDRPAAMYPPLP